MHFVSVLTDPLKLSTVGRTGNRLYNVIDSHYAEENIYKHKQICKRRGGNLLDEPHILITDSSVLLNSYLLIQPTVVLTLLPAINCAVLIIYNVLYFTIQF